MLRGLIAVAALTCIGGSFVLRSQVPTAASSPIFQRASPLEVGKGSGQLILVDVNGDRHLDLISAHLLDQLVSIHLGGGDGRFARAKSSPLRLGFAPGAIAADDVNADGMVELLVAARDERSEFIHILAGDGSGAFRPATRLDAASAFAYYKPRIVVTDVDADGTGDIVYANGRRSSVEILRGRGRGTFAGVETVALTPGGDFYTFALADVDVDGHIDLVAARNRGNESTGNVEIRRGIGRGAFAAAVDTGLALQRPAIGALADVDGDRLPDLVITHADSSQLSILLNDGGGRFRPAPNSPHMLAYEAFAVLVRDIDRDSRPDIIVATVNSQARPYQSVVTVLTGQPRRPAPGSPFASGHGAYQLAAGDINEDSKLDVIASSFESETVSILFGR